MVLMSRRCSLRVGRPVAAPKSPVGVNIFARHRATLSSFVGRDALDAARQNQTPTDAMESANSRVFDIKSREIEQDPPRESRFAPRCPHFVRLRWDNGPFLW